jgi:tetratricopeptide (TPR) repeat protein
MTKSKSKKPRIAETRPIAAPANNKGGKQKKKNFYAERALPKTSWYWLSGILALTFLVYLSAFKNEFVWDDLVYIQQNPLIYSINLPKIFSTYLAGNYHPLTVLVHAIEYSLFHFNTMGYHVVNVLIHVCNTALVFYFILRLSGNNMIGLITALLFGVHPLHVESVAWVAELKDVLYSFFFLCGLISYLKFTDQQKSKWYVLTIVLFLLSLLSKGMAVSFSLVLVLIDYYRGRFSIKKVWLEKIPFFALSVIFGLIAIKAQHSESALHSDTIGWAQRIVFAAYAYIAYIQKLILPMPISAYYPYPVGPQDAIPVLYYAYPALILSIIALCIWTFRKNKLIFFSIAFFTATILLVLKLMPVGYALMADRYTYIPSIGICFLAATGLYKLWANTSFGAGKITASALIILCGLFFGYTTYARCMDWKNELVLWTDAIEKNPKIAIAYANRAAYYADHNQFQEAEVDLNKAIELNGEYEDAFFNRGVIFQNTGRAQEALADYNKAIELNSRYSKAYINRGSLLRDAGQNDAALVDFNKALEINPNLAIAYNNRGILFQNQKRNEDALKEYSRSLELDPGYVSALINRGNVYLNLENASSALADYNAAIEIDPKFGMAYNNRAYVEMKMQDTIKACSDFDQAIQLGYQQAATAKASFCK